MRHHLILIICLCAFLTVHAQKKHKFGEFDEKYFEMTHCPIDSSAGAFVILNYGTSRLDHNYEIEFLYHGIIKILNTSEFKRADIKIPYSKNDRVGNFKASTYNFENGEIVESSISRKETLNEELDEDSRSFNFTFPNVKEGSIIEYQYSVNYGSIYRLNTWYFQQSIPTLRSEYRIVIPAFLYYQRLLTGEPLQKADVTYENLPFGNSSQRHQIHEYLALNVPAFKDEVYVAAESDYISKIDFELKETRIPGLAPKKILADSYGAYAKDLSESDYWQRIRDSKFTGETVEVIKSSSDSELATAKALYYFVRDNYEEDYDVNYETLRRVHKEQKGTARELNMVLAAMYNEAGLEVDMVRLSTRAHGKLHPYIPISRKFNYTVVRLKIGEETFLLDASEENIPFGVLPKFCLNGKGLVIAPQEEWVTLEPFKSSGVTYSGDFDVLEDGILEGTLTMRRNGYSAWGFTEDMEDEDEEKYKETFAENRDNWVITDHQIGELEDETKIDEKIELEVEDKLDDLGDILYLNPILMAQIVDNPFKKEERTFPINYGAPNTTTHLYKFNLGDFYEVEELPQPKSVALPNKSGRFLYSVTSSENVITLTCRISISKDEIPAADYPYLKEFYAQIVEKQGEQIVLRRK
ncbi:MAG: DUF3857 domain-containing protein [Cyclobacteriaceae bacterium]